MSHSGWENSYAKYIDFSVIFLGNYMTTLHENDILECC